MSKTVTIRLNNNIYEMFKNLAEGDNRTLSNFIETSVLRSIENSVYIDEYEMAEIYNNKSLNQSIKRGLQDAKLKKGRFVK
ncbi:MAG: CopG family transcriptional regulator [Candidatus Latescibacteria bacterium]|jgi:predicted transcriptional regulator|nr:CopG family transcriptional regulator [Candidatus Latescibacterota bacterium]